MAKLLPTETDLSPGDRWLRPVRQAKLTTPREFGLMDRSARPQRALPLFPTTTRPSPLFTLRLLSKETCLYASADWLSSSVSQKVARGLLHEAVRQSFVSAFKAASFHQEMATKYSCVFCFVCLMWSLCLARQCSFALTTLLSRWFQSKVVAMESPLFVHCGSAGGGCKGYAACL